MRIAGVSVNIKNPPSREQLTEMAKVSREFYNKKDAEKLINKAIDDSGLYKTSKQKPKKARRKKSNRGSGDNKQS